MNNHWKYEPLGSIAKTTSGGTPNKKNKEYYGGTIPWVRSGELNNGIIYDSEIKITKEGLKNSSAKIFPRGTLLIALYGATIGKLSFLGIPAATNQAICAIFENEKVILNYLFYFLLLKRPELIKQGIGGAQPNISQTILKKIIVPYPVSKTEQEKIVSQIEESFSQLDSAVATLNKTKQQLEIYRQAVLKEAFSGTLCMNRIVQTNLPCLVEEEKKDLPPIPNEWKYVKLSSLGELARGKSKHRPRNDKVLFENGKYPFIQTGDVKNAEKYITNYSSLYGDFGLQQSKLWKKGTLCITIAANIAETAFLGIDACFPDSIVGFLPSENVISDYVRYFIETQKSRLWAFAPATAQKNINLKTLENLVVPYCSIEEQKDIITVVEEKLSICSSIEKTINQSLQQAEALRQSILKQAFEGDKNV